MSLLRIWVIFFLFTAINAVLVQFVFLPHLLPHWHAGHGLLVGGDWVQFHRLATELLAKIQESGWQAWRLRPDLQAPAGIATIFYYFLQPEPWAMIPFNAAVHASSGIVLIAVLQHLQFNRMASLIGSLPLVIYPSAMMWYTQMHKDGVFILGSLLLLLAWVQLQVSISKVGISKTDQRSNLLLSVVWAFLGAGFIWVMRPYFVSLSLAVSAFLFLLVVLGRASKLFQNKTTPKNFALAFGLGFVLLAIQVPYLYLYGDLDPQSYTPPPARPFDTGIFPENSFIGQKLIGLSRSRDNFRFNPAIAGSNIDTDVGFDSTGDMIRYIPRALQIGLLAPFPSHWFQSGSVAPNTMMRRISALEMSGIYIGLCLFIVALIQMRKRLEIWMILAFNILLLLTFALVVVNVGTLYRMRYGFVMTLVAIGIARCTQYLLERRSTVQ